MTLHIQISACKLGVYNLGAFGDETATVQELVYGEVAWKKQESLL